MKLAPYLFTITACLSAWSANAQPMPSKLPAAIGQAYAKLGKAIATHDQEGVKQVWAEDFVVNAPNNAIAASRRGHRGHAVGFVGL